MIRLLKCLLSAMMFFYPISLIAQEVFIPNSKGELTLLKKANVEGVKTGGKSMLAFYGAKLTTSLVLDGKYSANFLPKSSTIFYVLLPQNISIQAFKLIPLKQKKKKRELPYMKTSVYSGSKTNYNDIQLMIYKLNEDLYELSPMVDLKEGEYALTYMEMGMPKDVYDFSVENYRVPFPKISKDALMAKFYPEDSKVENNNSDTDNSQKNITTESLPEQINIKEKEQPQYIVVFHTVTKGETLSSLSEKYNVSIEDIASWNDLPSKIKPNTPLAVDMQLMIYQPKK